MPRGVSKDLENFKETLEKGVILVGGEAANNNSIDVEDDTPVAVAIVVNVQGYGPHVGVICAVQGHVDEALQEGYEILEEWEMDHNPDYFAELEKEHGEDASDVFTETFDAIMWELPAEDFVVAIKGTPAEKFIDVVEYEEEEEVGEVAEGRVSENDDVIQVTIDEKGNGFPDVGDFVPGDDGNLYEVVSLGRIHTGQRSGASNYIHAEVVPADWDDVDEEDEFPAQVIVSNEEEDDQ